MIIKRIVFALLALLTMVSPAVGQSISADRFFLNTGPCVESSGTGSPESVVVGSPCDLWRQTDTPFDVWRKVSGTATNTGWVKVTNGVSAAITGSGTNAYLAAWTAATTLGNGPLTANVPLLNGNNYFTGVNEVSRVEPVLHFYQTGAAVGSKSWRFEVSGATFNLQTLNDAEDTIVAQPMSFTRAGDVSFNSTVSAYTGYRINGGATSGKLLIGNGTNFVASTPTWPNAAPTAGHFPRGDGTNYGESTLTLPNAATQGDLLTATGANAIGSTADVAVGQVLASGGVGAVPAYTASPSLTSIGGAANLALNPTTDLVLTPGGVVTLTSGKPLVSTYTSGWAGSGFTLNYNQSYALQSFMELDDLSVRGRMNVYELIIDQIRATNGNVFVSATGKVASVADNGGGVYTLQLEGPRPFVVGDLLRAQRFTGTGTYQSDVTMISVGGGGPNEVGIQLAVGSDPPVVGMEYVRLGSATDADRQGSIYMTADDTNAPYLNVLSGVAAFTDWGTAGKTKARLGNLNGICGYTSNVYGLCAGDSSATNITVDATNGFRIRNGTTDKFTADTSGNLSIVGDLSVGTNGALRSGATAYGTGAGYWLDYNGGTPRFRVGDPAGDNITWSGSGLSVKSSTFSLTASGPFVTANASSGYTTNNGYNFTPPTLTGGYYGMFAHEALLGGTSRYLSLSNVTGGSTVNEHTAIVSINDNGCSAGAVSVDSYGSAYGSGLSSQGVVSLYATSACGTPVAITLSGSANTITMAAATVNAGADLTTTNTLNTQTGVNVVRTGSVAYHLYNGGGIAEWLIGQNAHATSDALVFSKSVAGTVTDIMTIAPGGQVSIGPGFANTAVSPSFSTNAGALGTTAGAELKLASLGFTTTNEEHLGVYAYRTADGGSWNTTALGIGMDVDNTTRAAGTIWLYANGTIGLPTVTSGVWNAGSVTGIITTGNAAAVSLLNTGAGDVLFDLKRTGGTAVEWQVYIGTADTALRFYSTAERLSLTTAGVLTVNALASGNLTSASGVITSSSDERLKDITGPLTYGLAEVLQLRPIRYHWNATSGISTEPEYGGFGAAQVETSMPLAVSYSADGIRGLNTTVILAAVVNGEQAIDARLRAVEAKVGIIAPKVTSVSAAQVQAEIVARKATDAAVYQARAAASTASPVVGEKIR